MSSDTNNPEALRPRGDESETIIPPTREEAKTVEDLKRIAKETTQKGDSAEIDQKDGNNVKAIVEKFSAMNWKSTIEPNGEDLGIPQTLEAPVLREDGQTDTEGWRTSIVLVEGKSTVLMEELDENGKVKNSRYTSLDGWEQEQMNISAKQKIEAMTIPAQEPVNGEQKELATNPKVAEMPNDNLEQA